MQNKNGPMYCQNKVATGLSVQDIAASYVAGALGGFTYLRLLNRSVDSLGSFSLTGGGSSARLLIPVILTLSYNRYVLVVT